MRNLKKISAFFIALTLAAVSLAGCADTTWSYKDDKMTIPIGVYIFNLYRGYNQAYSSVEDNTGDILSQDMPNPENEDETVNAGEYILENSDRYTRQILVINQLFEELGLEITAEEQAEIDASVESSWSYYGATFESFGIAKESFKMVDAEVNVKSQKIFEAIYGEGGEKEVSEEDLKKHFEDNYTDYSYIQVSLAQETASEEGTTGDVEPHTHADGETHDYSDSTTALSDEEIEALKNKFAVYEGLVNAGDSTMAEIAESYVNDFSMPTTDDNGEAISYITSNTEVLENSSIAADLIEALEEMENKEAQFIVVGTGASAVGYLVYKNDIKSKTSEFFNDDNNSLSVLANMKNEEYADMLEKRTDEYTNYTKNDAAVNKYSPDMFTDAFKQQSTGVA